MTRRQKRFSLKDHLFNAEKVAYLAHLIHEVHPDFQQCAFEKNVLAQFPALELKERIAWIREKVRELLPADYREAVDILVTSLPPALDDGNHDNDFGDFIFAPYADFVATYGCTKKDVAFSLQALHEMTKRFSAEDAIRYFLNAFPEETLNTMEKWSKDKNYHVRRLASEGTRPRLPWCQKVKLDHKEVIMRILDKLYCDPTRYVVRSVANHMNDIAKKNPDLVVSTLKRWHKDKTCNQKELAYLTRHALRTLVKDGNKDALKLLGYRAEPRIVVRDFGIITKKVQIGERVVFDFEICAQKDENLMIDYVLHFQGKNGNLRPKVFKIKKCAIQKGEALHVTKKHPLRNMTTKRLYTGTHKVALQINGEIYAEGEFLLT